MTPLLHASSQQIERFRAWCERMAEVARDSNNSRVSDHLDRCAQVAGGGFYADTQGMRRVAY